MSQDRAQLEQRAAQGDVEAQIALGRLHEETGNQQLARGWYARAAKQDSVAGLRRLAMNLMTREPIVAGDGVNMIRAAAARGDGEAAYVCAALAIHDAGLNNRGEVALECLFDAAESGYRPAQEELTLLAGGHLPAQPPDGGWHALKDRIAMDKWSSAPSARTVFEDPRVLVIEHCAPPEVCDWLIAQTRPRLKKAEVYDEKTARGREEEARNNSTAEFSIPESSVLIGLIRARAVAISGLPMRGLEKVSILHYAVGQQFVEHVDYLHPSVPAYAREIAQHGQRAATFLLYLSDDYEGGETQFFDLDWRYKGRKGDALLFWNVDAKGAPHLRTRHAGTPTTKGEKWVLSQWLRQPPR